MIFYPQRITRLPLVANGLRSSIFYLPGLAWFVLIFIFSLLPGEHIPESLASMPDKWLHGFIYFFAALLLYMGAIRYNLSLRPSGSILLLIIVVSVICGGVIEVLQENLVPQRHGDWRDFLANSIGSVAAVLLLNVIQRVRA